MANLAQMGVDAFWGQLKQLESLAGGVRADLDSDRLDLQHAYTVARNDTAKDRGAVAMKLLQPQIHNNSVLRLRYRDLNRRFVAAVNAAGGALQKAGLSTPRITALSGLGLAPVILVPVAAVTALGVAWAIYETVRLATDAQRRSTAALVGILNNPNSTPAEKAAAAAALAKTAGTPPAGFDMKSLVPILGLVLAIIVAPRLLETFTPRRAAA